MPSAGRNPSSRKATIVTHAEVLALAARIAEEDKTLLDRLASK